MRWDCIYLIHCHCEYMWDWKDWQIDRTHIYVHRVNAIALIWKEEKKKKDCIFQGHAHALSTITLQSRDKSRHRRVGAVFKGIRASGRKEEDKKAKRDDVATGTKCEKASSSPATNFTRQFAYAQFANGRVTSARAEQRTAERRPPRRAPFCVVIGWNRIKSGRAARLSARPLLRGGY